MRQGPGSRRWLWSNAEFSTGSFRPFSSEQIRWGLTGLDPVEVLHEDGQAGVGVVAVHVVRIASIDRGDFVRRVVSRVRNEVRDLKQRRNHRCEDATQDETMSTSSRAHLDLVGGVH